MSNRLNVHRRDRRPVPVKPPKTLIRIRPWLEAKRRPGDGMWSLWYHGTVRLDEETTYSGWVIINTARNVRTLLETAPKGFV